MSLVPRYCSRPNVSGRARRHADGRGRTFLEGPKRITIEIMPLSKTYGQGPTDLVRCAKTAGPEIMDVAVSTVVGRREPNGLL